MTASENFLAEFFPQAEWIGRDYDFLLWNTPVEVKECIPNRNGRFKINFDHHRSLKKEGGIYLFALKNRYTNAITDSCWIPAKDLNLLEYPAYWHLYGFEQVHIPWREIFNNEHPLPKEDENISGPQDS